jgi:outer membrane receptor protein involved in Fe transport
MALSAIIATQSAAAQEAAGGDTGAQQNNVNVIVVTAQKREEDAQDVPIAISAFGGQALRERAVTSVSSLAALAPNVNLDGGTPFSGSSAVLAATIRGIGSDDFAFNIDPGVGVYLDGVYLARTVGANQDLPDVERVEILRGPQGTLFGRNTIGGAVSIVTHEPADTFRLVADLTYGSYDLVRARGTVDVPITDGIFSSVTFALTSRDGFVRRIPFDDQRASNSDTYLNFNHARYETSSREGGDNTVNLRGKLRFDDGGPFAVTLAGDYTHQNSSSQANRLIDVLNVPGNFAGNPPLPGTGFDPSGTTGFLFSGLYNFCIGATAAEINARGASALCGARGTNFLPQNLLASFAGVNVDGDPLNDRLPWDARYISADPDTSYATGPSFNRLTAWGVAATADLELSSALSLRSITAYRETSWASGSDLDGSPLSMLELSFEQNQWQFSQELQLLGNLLDDRLNFVLGAYYFKESGDLHDYVTFSEGLLQVDGPNDFETENYAFFGQVNYRPAEWIGVTLGARYTNEDKQFVGGQQDLNGFNYKLFGCADSGGTIFPNGAFPLAPVYVPCFAALAFPDGTDPTRVYVPGVNTKSFEDFSPMVGIQLHPTENVMIYGSWSRGYRTGGWTTRLTNPQGNVAPDFDEETASTWEIGVKSTLFDRMLQLNAAAFTTDYSDLQLNIQIGTSPTIDNAGDARIRGFELEAVAAPFDGFTISASLGYTDAHYTRIEPAALVNASPIPGIQAGIFVGAPLPKTAEWSTNISPRYQAELGNGGTLTFLADWSHNSALWNDIARTISLRRPAYDLVNASVTYEEPDEHWSLTLGGTNLTDDRYIVNGGSNIAAGVVFGSYNRPREWYLRLGMDF